MLANERASSFTITCREGFKHRAMPFRKFVRIKLGCYSTDECACLNTQ